MNSNLLAIPFRITGDTNLAGQIEESISKEYFQSATSFDKDIQFINQLKLETAKLNNGYDDTSELMLKKYYIHLSTLPFKFPVNASEFSWYSTLGYNISNVVKLRSFLFERVSILFNLGALYSQEGVTESKLTDEGLKKSCIYFQNAAGCFDLILQLHKSSKSSDNTVEFPPDLHPNTIEALKQLMLAHSQEVFWQKAVANKLKDSVIARLAIQVSDFYSTALEAANKSIVIRSEWIRHLTVKKYHFKAAAEFRAALASSSSFNYGEEIAHLRIAFRECDIGAKNLRYVSDLVANDIKSLKETISEALRRAERDNDLIYLKPVPNEKDLVKISPATMVKVLISEDLSNVFAAIKSNRYGGILFADLLPYVVIQVAMAYRERQETFISDQFIKPIKALNSMFTRFLNERNLPASIDAIQKPESIPETIIQHSNEIIGKGGLESLRESLNDISKFEFNSEHLLEGARERLAIEASEDKILLQRQGSKRWTRDSSREASSDLTNSINELQELLSQAKASDKIVQGKFSDIEPYLEIYCGGTVTLEEFIPDSEFLKVKADVNIAVIDLREALNNGSKLEEERRRFLESIEIKSKESSISSKIVSEYKSIQSKFEGSSIEKDTFEPVFEKHISIFNTDISRLQKLRDKQIQLERKIDALNKIFEKTQSADQINSDRQSALQSLEDIYGLYIELISSLSEGSKFYSDFISRASDLLKSCDEFVQTRRVEGRDLESELNDRSTASSEDQMEESDRYDNSQGEGSSWASHNVDQLYEETETKLSHPQLQLQPQVQGQRQPLIHAPKVQSGVWDPSQGIKFG